MGQSSINYQSYYREKLEQGLEFQDYIYDKLYSVGLPVISFSSKKYQLLYGENKPGIEIKFDNKFKETGNIYIETAEKSNPSLPEYIPSGIYRNDNSWLYIIGNREKAFVFPKKYLIILEKRFKKVSTPTSRGFLIPIGEAEKYSIKIV